MSNTLQHKSPLVLELLTDTQDPQLLQIVNVLGRGSFGFAVAVQFRSTSVESRETYVMKVGLDQVSIAWEVLIHLQVSLSAFSTDKY